MKQFYSPLKALLMVCGILIFNRANSQNPSGNASGECGTVIANFNTSSDNHASPSIYGGMFDSSFYYNAIRGYWTDMVDGRTAGPVSPRILSIISRPYVNPSPAGQFNVGFYYIVPNAAIDQFQVRIVSISPSIGGETIANIVASSGVQSFASWSAPQPYVDYDHTSSAGTSAANTFLTGDSGHVCIRINDPDITNAPGTFYRVEVAYVLNTPVTDNFYAVYDNLSIGQTTAPAPLPVNFIGITANRMDNGIAIRWDVGDEINVQRYEVERSENGVSFSTIGTVSANKKQVYNFTDYNNKIQQVFYRIKSVDLDGTAKYSGIVRFKNNNSYSDKLLLYPVPVHNQLTIQHSLLTRGKITVATVDGRILKVVTPGPGVSNTMIDVSSLSSGMYILKLEKDDGKIETGSFVKE